MPGSPDSLKSALRTFLIAALSLMNSAGADVSDDVIWGYAVEWERRDEDSFAIRTAPRKTWSRWFLENPKALTSLPEHAAAVEALETDERTRILVGQLVGTAQSTFIFNPEMQLMSLVALALPPEPPLTVNEEAVAGLVDEFVDAITAESFETFLVAPLLRLRVPRTVTLGDAIELAQLPDDEISRSLQTHLIRSPFGAAPFVFGLTGVSGVRARLSFPRVIGDIDTTSAEERLAPVQSAADAVPEIVAALRLFKDGDVVSPGYVTYGQRVSLSPGVMMSWANFDPAPAPTSDFVLADEEIKAFQDFFDAFRAAKTRKVIAAAVRRFSFAAERHRDDDRLVDLMVAAEGLLLSEIGTSDRGELRYRTALRAAYYLDDVLPYSRRAIYTFVRRAYDARSAIVHGSEPDASLFRGLDEKTVAFPDFVTAFRGLVRQMLRKAIDRAATGHAGIADWDKLIIGS